ncbi:hypothetical protein PHLCEN_2v4185 [Hermanssonia centrifuga]|uniref:Uncharacterized protein n=1 Tax=Hermanssonia centrifuga TaxID=98765 RepID=A0A2R6PZ16_9APHY|nr:hypothetical protein PHLCEN_2v4185 [Hermanssonia centrifuga]
MSSTTHGRTSAAMHLTAEEDLNVDDWPNGSQPPPMELLELSNGLEESQDTIASTLDHKDAQERTDLPTPSSRRVLKGASAASFAKMIANASPGTPRPEPGSSTPKRKGKGKEVHDLGEEDEFGLMPVAVGRAIENVPILHGNTRALAARVDAMRATVEEGFSALETTVERRMDSLPLMVAAQLATAMGKYQHANSSDDAHTSVRQLRVIQDKLGQLQDAHNSSIAVMESRFKRLDNVFTDYSASVSSLELDVRDLSNIVCEKFGRRPPHRELPRSPPQGADSCTTLNLSGSSPDGAYPQATLNLPGSPPVLPFPQPPVTPPNHAFPRAAHNVPDAAYASPDGPPKKRQRVLRNRSAPYAALSASSPARPAPSLSHTAPERQGPALTRVSNSQMQEHVTDVLLGRREWNARTIRNQFFNLTNCVFTQHTHLAATVTNVSLDDNIEFVRVSFRNRPLALSFVNAWSLRDPAFCPRVTAVLST